MPLMTADTDVEQADVYEPEAKLVFKGTSRTVRET